MTTQTEKPYASGIEIREAELNSILRDIPEKRSLLICWNNTAA